MIPSIIHVTELQVRGANRWFTVIVPFGGIRFRAICRWDWSKKYWRVVSLHAD